MTCGSCNAPIVPMAGGGTKCKCAVLYACKIEKPPPRNINKKPLKSQQKKEDEKTKTSKKSKKRG